MSFLAPLFLLGLAGLAIPTLIHLVQRERKRPIEFPSLMFLQRIPYQSVRRRRVRNWLLLLLRAAAIAMLVLAFARPFFRHDPNIVIASAGAREVVILLDQSASMGYGDHWQRAKTEAKKVIDGLGAADRATLVLFSRNSEENVRATADRGRLDAAVDAAHVTSGATRYAPALRLAQSILTRSPLGHREAVIISDFQRSGWERHEDVSFPAGAILTPVSVVSGPMPNLSVASVTFARTRFAGEDRVTVTAAVTNHSDAPVPDVPVSLEIDGRLIQSQTIKVGANASATATFSQFTLSESNVRGVVHAGTDAFPQDNTFNFVLSPARAAAVLIVEPDGLRPEDDIYLPTALSIGSPAAFDVTQLAASRVTATNLDKAAVVVVNDTFVPGPVGAEIKRFVERGGGLFVLLGAHAGKIDSESTLLPGTPGPAKDAPVNRPSTFGFIDYTHPIFEIFKTPHSGDFSTAHFYQYRTLEPGATDRVLARFDDGVVAMAERTVSGGRVITMDASLADSETDLGRQAIFLPFLHQVMRYLARYQEQPSWYTAGQRFDPSDRIPALAPDPVTHQPRTSALVSTPSGGRLTPGAGGEPMSFELTEQGFYGVRPAGGTEARPLTVAANIDPSESDLTPMDLREFVGVATGRATENLNKPDDGALKPDEIEKKQSIWWYVMLIAVLVLVVESILANRASARLVGSRRFVG